MHDSWEGSGSRPDLHPDAHANARAEGWVQARGPEQRPPEPRVQDPRMQDSRNQDPRIPEPRIQEARMNPAEPRGYPQRGGYPAQPEPPRQPESYRVDARIQELGQRVQAFGAPAQPVQSYRGAPLPVGQPSEAYAPSGEYERNYPPRAPFAGEQFSHEPISQNQPPRDPAPHGGAYSYPYGIPPSAPDPAMPPAAEKTAEAAGAETGAAERPQLPASTDGGDALKGGFQRVAQAVRAAIPLVQKLLPLLDGNLATTVSALLAPQAAAHPPQPQAVVQVDLEPVERGMTELRTSHRELKTQVAEQGTTLKRVEDHLERVREATDRNTLEQQELVEDVRAVGTRVSRFIVVGVILLALSVGLNVYLLIQIQHIFR